MVYDEDMVFRTMNGLPGEFDPLKSAIGAQRDLKFHELVFILKAEESRIHKSKGESGSTSVFVATQTLHDPSTTGASSSAQLQMNNTGSFSASVAQSPQPPVIQSSQP